MLSVTCERGVGGASLKTMRMHSTKSGEREMAGRQEVLFTTVVSSTIIMTAAIKWSEEEWGGCGVLREGSFTAMHED